jgi:hypothetical protein
VPQPEALSATNTPKASAPAATSDAPAVFV